MLNYASLPRCWLQQHVQKRQGSERVTFHKLPQDDIRKQRWLANIKREGNLPKPGNCFVCSDHFTADDYERDLQALDYFFIYFAFS